MAREAQLEEYARRRGQDTASALDDARPIASRDAEYQIVLELEEAMGSLQRDALEYVFEVRQLLSGTPQIYRILFTIDGTPPTFFTFVMAGERLSE